MSQYKVLGTISRANVRLRGVFGLPFFAVKENLFPHQVTKVTWQSDVVPVDSALLIFYSSLYIVHGENKLCFLPTQMSQEVSYCCYDWLTDVG